MKKGIIVLISGPSGVGKGTILKELINNKAINLTFSVSMTTRAKREKEVHGEHYFFVSQEEFAANLKRDNFLEHATFVGNSYGTPKDYVLNLLNEGKNVLIEIEVKGAKTLISKVDPKDIISFYIMPPSVDDLIYRLKHRGTEDDATIMRRAEQFKDEIKYKNQYDHAVVNDDLETCIKEVTALIEARINKK
jgi:guanylate kinase